MMLLRRMLGDVLRRHRLRQSRTLRDVSGAAGVSLGYLSEVERGRKEASSELLAAICGALDVSMAEVLREVSDDLARDERRTRVAPVGFVPTTSRWSLASTGGAVRSPASPHSRRRETVDPRVDRWRRSRSCFTDRRARSSRRDVTSPHSVSRHWASAAPIHERGLHSRAGNAMARTRAAVLDGAARAVEKHGARKATMADIASLAGIAKGTLYNHFRAKEAVYAAALDAGIRSLAAECVSAAHDNLGEALALAADRLGTNPAIRRIAADEPSVLASLVTPTDMPLWGLARNSVRDVLVAAGVATSASSIDLVVRWLTTFVSAAAEDGRSSELDRSRVGVPAQPDRPGRTDTSSDAGPRGSPWSAAGSAASWHGAVDVRTSGCAGAVEPVVVCPSGWPQQPSAPV